jgi:hypothetical protein
MNESEWLSGADPMPMLQLLRGRASDRKLRLFACACVQRLSLPDERIGAVVRTSEFYADAKAGWNELSAARRMARVIAREAMQRPGQVGYGAGPVAWVEATAHPSAWVAAGRVALIGRSDLVRDIFGNPFRPVALDPAWLRWNDGLVARLAQSIYDRRSFADLPVLADAVEEAGCAEPDTLGHCRGGGEHVRGCWPVDLILGKG